MLEKEIEALTEKLKNENTNVRDQAANDIIKIGQLAIPHLLPLLEEKKWETRFRSAQILEQMCIYTSTAYKVLESALEKEKDEHVQKQIKKALDVLKKKSLEDSIQEETTSERGRGWRSLFEVLLFLPILFLLFVLEFVLKLDPEKMAMPSFFLALFLAYHGARFLEQKFIKKHNSNYAHKDIEENNVKEQRKQRLSSKQLLIIFFVAIAAICLCWAKYKQNMEKKHNLRALGLLPLAIKENKLIYVTKLDFSKTQINNGMLLHLKSFTGLRSMNLEYTRISDEGLVYLRSLTNLTKLNLYATNISNKGLVHLESLTNLTWLDLGSTKVTNAGIVKLKKVLTKCKIHQ